MISSQVKGNSRMGKIVGWVQIGVGLRLVLFASEHRPVSGLVDAMSRRETWVFNPLPYYLVLLFAALLVWFGYIRVRGRRAARREDGGEALERITKAKELLDAGAIDPGEFERIKKEALG